MEPDLLHPRMGADTNLSGGVGGWRELGLGLWV